MSTGSINGVVIRVMEIRKKLVLPFEIYYVLYLGQTYFTKYKLFQKRKDNFVLLQFTSPLEAIIVLNSL